MASQGAIINAALHHLKETESSTPTTDESTWVKRIRDRLDERARALLESHSWNFARAVEQLTASEPTPAGWDFGFNKPATCLRIMRVTNSSDPNAPNIPYEDRAGRICSNSAETWLTSVSSYWIAYHGSWPQCFADAVACDVAVKVAPVTEAGRLDMDELRRDARGLLLAAKTWDAQQTPNREVYRSSWLNARRSGFGSREGG